MIPVDLVLPTVALIALGIFSRYALGALIAPGAFFTGCWIFVILFSFSSPLFGGEQYPVWEGTLWWIVVTLAMVVAGSYLGSRLGGVGRVSEAPMLEERDLSWIRTLIIVTSIGAFVWPLIAPALETPEGSLPPSVQILLGMAYTCPLLGGLLYPVCRGRSYRWLSLLSLSPGVFFAVANVSRTKVVIQFTFWFAGYFAMQLLLHRGAFRLLSGGHVVAASLSFALFLAIGVVIVPFRNVPGTVPLVEKFAEYWDLLQDTELLRQSWEWMNVSFFGHVAYFSWYFERAWATPPSAALGSQTMSGLYRVFIGELPPAIYTDEVAGISTNVFTIFKPPIEDWTLGGSLLAFFVFGSLAGWAYQRVRSGAIWPIAILLHFYTSSMNPGGWFLAYNSITGSFVVTGVYLAIVERRVRRQHGTDNLERRNVPTGDHRPRVGFGRSGAASANPGHEFGC